ncbi:hypothetical protein GCM10010277_74410 [Streptomyces longisporoflavus]|uniref:hypothetical protein n=1 Tax=Streptomyces longisporoflavus TaxID=28044 RepID=UPI00167EB5E1|nr:hypothetical protein [Streptomyces longisporoflavus]GGV66556.1 hypothetical protein GCM10010277_74410 [Streptomyces longisporoflavus]
MDTLLTVGVLLVLLIGAAYVIQRLNAQRADRIALHHYSHSQPTGRDAHGAATRPLPALPRPPSAPERRDHRDGGRGRRRPRRRIHRAHGQR